MTAHRSCHESYGVAFDVVVDHACDPAVCTGADLATRVAERLPPGARERTGGQPVGQVGVTCRGATIEVIDAEGARRSFDDARSALHAFDGAIRRIVAVHAPGLVFVHAGVVAVDGRAIVFPGRSMTGKTTLVAALVEAGATYLSDEYAPLDADGLVHPYPRRLSIRGGDGRREVPAGDLGGATAHGPLPVSVVAAIGFDPDATFGVADASQAACAAALLDNAVAARVRSAEVLAVTARVARTTRFVTGSRGEARDAVAAVMALATGGAS